MSADQGTVAALWRYPVKSMLGEELAEAALSGGGVDGDRAMALLDSESGRVATAKHPRRWRELLQFRAVRSGAVVRITARSPGRSAVRSASPRSGRRAWSAPEDVLEHGVTAEVPHQTLEIAQGTPGGAFVDYASVHLITTATLDGIGAEAVRYRPNIVIAGDGPPFAENDWLGRELTVGEVRLRITLPTPRCSVPTLEHGELPRAPHAVRVPVARNRVDVPGFGVLPCAGVYAEVIDPGVVRRGDAVRID